MWGLQIGLINGCETFDRKFSNLVSLDPSITSLISWILHRFQSFCQGCLKYLTPENQQHITVVKPFPDSLTNPLCEGSKHLWGSFSVVAVAKFPSITITIYEGERHICVLETFKRFCWFYGGTLISWYF